MGIGNVIAGLMRQSAPEPKRLPGVPDQAPPKMDIFNITEDTVIPKTTEEQIKQDEGDKVHVYKDTHKLDTVGTGFNMESAGARESFKAATGLPDEDFDAIKAGKKNLTPEQDANLFHASVAHAEAGARTLLPEYDQMPDAVRGAVVNLVFNNGVHGFAGYHDAVAALKAGDYNKAADAVLDSKAAKELPLRYQRIAKALRSAAEPEVPVHQGEDGSLYHAVTGERVK